MIISSWNVNSVRARINNIKEYLKKSSPDIVMMQEIKTEEKNYPFDEFKSLKYESYVFGQKSYNGVAFLSKSKLNNIKQNIFKDKMKQSRIISGELTYKKKKICIPNVYQNSSLEIIPLRIAWVSQNSDHVKRQLHPFLKVSWTWFTMPIVATSEPLSNFNYTTGQCPISEDIGPKMVNLPCNLNSTDAQAFEEILSRSLI